MKKGLIILIAIIALISVGVIASDLVIDSELEENIAFILGNEAI